MKWNLVSLTTFLLICITGIACLENTTFSYRSKRYVTYNRLNSIENLTETKLLTSMSTTTIKISLLVVKISPLYPEIADERKQYMNWDRNYLMHKFEKSGKDKALFLKNLRFEYNNRPSEIINDDNGRVQKQAGITQPPNDGSTTTRQQGRYVRPLYMRASVLDSLVLALNGVRSTVEPPADEMLKLSWNYNYETEAWREANSCNFKGRQTAEARNKPGENLWIGWGRNRTSFDPTVAVTTWKNEKKYFDARLQFCIGGPCEYYVQLILRSASKVGCAWVFCDTALAYGVTLKNAIYLTCLIGPGSISLPYVPYFQGVPCSFCPPVDDCEENLCTNAMREIITGTMPPVYSPGAMNPEAVIALFILLLLLGITILVTGGVYLIARFSRRNNNPQVPQSTEDTYGYFDYLSSFYSSR